MPFTTVITFMFCRQEDEGQVKRKQKAKTRLVESVSLLIHYLLT